MLFHSIEIHIEFKIIQDIRYIILPMQRIDSQQFLKHLFHADEKQLNVS